VITPLVDTCLTSLARSSYRHSHSLVALSTLAVSALRLDSLFATTMGGDGGSIPDRSDLVRTRGKAQVADKRSQLVAVWCFCALSKVSFPCISCLVTRGAEPFCVLETSRTSVSVMSIRSAI
jgi:hypothetical protein